MKEKIGEYKVIKKVGEGAFGKVYECADKDGKSVAIKEIDKSKLNEELFDKLKIEAKISTEMNHPNIVKCYNTLQSAKNFYLVFEYCSGGDLLHYLKDKKTLELKEAVYLMRQLRDAYQYLLQKSIIHRDIKLENILLGSRDKGNLKLSDFGCSKVDPIGKTYCGTPKYMALEVIEENTKYNYKADLWAIGLCCWELIFGYNQFPFSTKNVDELKRDMKKYGGNNLRFPLRPALPQIFYGFFKSILNISPDLRMEAEQFVNHPVFSYDPEDPANAADLKSSAQVAEDVKNMTIKASGEPKGAGHAEADGAAPKPDAVVDGVVTFYNERLLEIKLTYQTVVALKEYLKKELNVEFYSHFAGLCLILLSKALIKSENAVNSITMKKNLYKIEGFESFIKYPNQYNKFRLEFDEVTEQVKVLDREIYSNLMNNCFSETYFESIKHNLYHKASSDVQKFYKDTFSHVQNNYKAAFSDSSARADIEKQLKKVIVILKGKVTENLAIFY